MESGWKKKDCKGWHHINISSKSMSHLSSNKVTELMSSDLSLKLQKTSEVTQTTMQPSPDLPVNED